MIASVLTEVHGFDGVSKKLMARLGKTRKITRFWGTWVPYVQIPLIEGYPTINGNWYHHTDLDIFDIFLQKDIVAV